MTRAPIGQGVGAPADAGRATAASQSNPSVSSKAGIPSAGELGRRCADSISPDLFAPLVKRVADDIYERLMDSVQDYLCDNAEWNIAQRIATAEAQAASDRMELEGLRERYGQLIYSVARKYEGESRHETALRYIRERENSAQAMSAETAETAQQAQGQGPASAVPEGNAP